MARKGKMIVRDIKSTHLRETMEIKIYLPEAFTPLYKYYICIMQDGNDYFQMGRLATVSDKLHEDGRIENTVFAGIHYKNRLDRLKKYHPDGEENEAYTKFLVQEAVPLLDEIIPTFHMGQGRALMGDSLSGTLALMTAIRYPNTFGKVIMQSPLVNETVINTVRNAEQMDSIDIYHTVGENETEVEITGGKKVDFVGPNRELQAILHTKKIHYTYKELPGGEHTWRYWQQDLPYALEKMFN